MRLLHTQKLELSEFNRERSTPYYAILSHTWGEDEFIFSDFAKSDRRSSSGWRKIVKCCELAAADGWEYAWVDTCCIDKSSSAKLTEAINSMWKWYRSSQICYVHLADCYISNGKQDLPESRWFTRGWTLQELLAPERIVFYDADWQDMGSRSYLQHYIANICRIAPDHLTNPIAASVATKMSWASRRKTTREEDLAYSLLGLFDINMSLIYGEGSKAFFRLQSEIIRSSIFAWSTELFQGSRLSGMLAPSVSCFEKSNYIVPKDFYNLPQKPYQMTNHGLQIELRCMEFLDNIATFPYWTLKELFIDDYDQTLGRYFFDQLTGEPERLTTRGSSSLRLPKATRIWLVMLPCVRASYRDQPIGLLILGSPEGRYTRCSTPVIWTWKDTLPRRSNSRFESMSFLIANETLASVGPLPRGNHPGDIFPFLEVCPASQQKVRYAKPVHSNRLLFATEAKPPFAQHSQLQGAQCVFIVDINAGQRLVIIFGCRIGKCSVFMASKEEGSQLQSELDLTSDGSKYAEKPLSSYIGRYIVTLGGVDDYTLDAAKELRILIRTRKLFREVLQDDGVMRKNICCAITLDLCTIPEK